MTPATLLATNGNTILEKYKRLRDVYVINETYIDKAVSPATSVVIDI